MNVFSLTKLQITGWKANLEAWVPVFCWCHWERTVFSASPGEDRTKTRSLWIYCSHWVLSPVVVSVLGRIPEAYFMIKATAFLQTHIEALSQMNHGLCMYLRLWPTLLVKLHFKEGLVHSSCVYLAPATYQMLLWQPGETGQRVRGSWSSVVGGKSLNLVLRNLGSTADLWSYFFCKMSLTLSLFLVSWETFEACDSLASPECRQTWIRS